MRLQWVETCLKKGPAKSMYSFTWVSQIFWEMHFYFLRIILVLSVSTFPYHVFTILIYVFPISIWSCHDFIFAILICPACSNTCNCYCFGMWTHWLYIIHTAFFPSKQLPSSKVHYQLPSSSSCCITLASSFALMNNISIWFKWKINMSSIFLKSTDFIGKGER